MNKHQRKEIRSILLTQIGSATEDLRSRRLESALARIDADNFGACFKCGQDLPLATLRSCPERVICAHCLEGTKD